MLKPEETKPLRLTTAIGNLLLKLETMNPTSDEYAKASNQLAALYKLNEMDKPEPRQRVSPDTLILAATNIAGIAMIIRHEQFNAIATKAISFVYKPR